MFRHFTWIAIAALFLSTGLACEAWAADKKCKLDRVGGSAYPESAVDLSSYKAFERFLDEDGDVDGLEGRTILLPLSSVVLGKRLGSGMDGVAYCLGADCARVIKIALRTPAVGSFENESRGQKRFERTSIQHAYILEKPAGKKYYLIKNFVRGESLRDLLVRGLTGEQISRLAWLFTMGYVSKLPMDLNPANWMWQAEPSSSLGRFVTVETFLHSRGLKDLYDLSNWRSRYFEGNDAGYFTFRAQVLRNLSQYDNVKMPLESDDY